MTGHHLAGIHAAIPLLKNASHLRRDDELKIRCPNVFPQ